MHEFIIIKVVSCFPSFEGNLRLRNNQDGYLSLQRAINRKSPLNAVFLILNTGKEENIHFAVSLRIRKADRNNNFTIKRAGHH